MVVPLQVLGRFWTPAGFLQGRPWCRADLEVVREHLVYGVGDVERHFSGGDGELDGWCVGDDLRLRRGRELEGVGHRHTGRDRDPSLTNLSDSRSPDGRFSEAVPGRSSVT